MNIPDAANQLLELFKNPELLPDAVAQVFMHRKDSSPCRKWSYSNQILMVLAGTYDARGFHQWKEANRQVKKGAKAFHILSPCIKQKDKIVDGEKKKVPIVIGFKPTPVFRIEDTEGDELPNQDDRDVQYIQQLPLLSVAKKWGVIINAVPANERMLGCFSRNKLDGQLMISLAVQNLSTWTHELCHASDYMLNRLEGDHAILETVAEFGGCVILRMLGKDYDSDPKGCYNYILHQAESEGSNVISLCIKTINRTCNVIDNILKEYEDAS